MNLSQKSWRATQAIGFALRKVAKKFVLTAFIYAIRDKLKCRRVFNFSAKTINLEGSGSSKLIPIKLDRGGGFPWLFADYRKEINTAVTRQRTVISKQCVSLGKRTFKQPAKVKIVYPS